MAETISCTANFPAFVVSSTITDTKLTAIATSFSVTGNASSFSRNKAPLTAEVEAFTCAIQNASILWNRSPLTTSLTGVLVATQQAGLNIPAFLPLWAGSSSCDVSCNNVGLSCSHNALLAQLAAIDVAAISADVKRPDMVTIAQAFVVGEVAAELLLNPPKEPLEASVSELVISGGAAVFPRQRQPLIAVTRGIVSTPWAMQLNHNKATFFPLPASAIITGLASWQYSTKNFSTFSLPISVAEKTCDLDLERRGTITSSTVSVSPSHASLIYDHSLHVNKAQVFMATRPTGIEKARLLQAIVSSFVFAGHTSVLDNTKTIAASSQNTAIDFSPAHLGLSKVLTGEQMSVAIGGALANFTIGEEWIPFPCPP